MHIFFKLQPLYSTENEGEDIAEGEKEADGGRREEITKQRIKGSRLQYNHQGKLNEWDKKVVSHKMKAERFLAVVKNEEEHLEWLENEIQSLSTHIKKKKEKIKNLKVTRKENGLKDKVDTDYHIVKSTLRKGNLKRSLNQMKKQRDKSKKRILKYKNKVFYNQQLLAESGTSEESFPTEAKPGSSTADKTESPFIDKCPVENNNPSHGEKCIGHSINYDHELEEDDDDETYLLS